MKIEIHQNLIKINFSNIGTLQESTQYIFRGEGTKKSNFIKIMHVFIKIKNNRNKIKNILY